MARVVSFQVHGLAGRSEVVTHSLRPDVNVIWGFNGSGKTSLLKLLHSALRGDATSVLNVPFAEARVTIQDNAGQEIVRSLYKDDLPQRNIEELPENTLSIYWTRLTNSTDSTTSNVIPWVTEPSEKTGARYQHGYLPISRVSESRPSNREPAIRELIDEASFDRLFAAQIKNLWRQYNQRATAQINSAQDLGLARILGLVLSTSVTGRPRPPRTINNAETAYQMVRSFLDTQRVGKMMRLNRKRFLNKYETDTLTQEVVAEVAEVQESIAQALRPQHDLENLINDLYGGNKKLEFKGDEVVIRIGENTIPLESLSSGEKQLLQILLECLAADKSLVLVDEPELSLHVDWQHQLIRNMRLVNKDAQLIMATHSPEVMATLADHHIFQL